MHSSALFKISTKASPRRVCKRSLKRANKGEALVQTAPCRYCFHMVASAALRCLMWVQRGWIIYRWRCEKQLLRLWVPATSGGVGWEPVRQVCRSRSRRCFRLWPTKQRKDLWILQCRKEMEKSLRLCRKTALRRDGSAEKLSMRRAQEIAENTENTFTDLNDNQPESITIIKLMFPLSLKTTN